MLEIKGVRFEVEIVHKRIKNLYLRLEETKLTVSAPMRMQDYEVYRFIEKKRDWIWRTYQRQMYRKREGNKYSGGDVFYIFDVPHRLVMRKGKKNVTIGDRTIFLTYPGEEEDAIRYLYQNLDRELLNRAEYYLNKHLVFLRDYGYMDIPELKCRVMKTKWGVCYTRKNRICLSSYLIHYPLECLEYVMIHEMVHFIVPNHSKRFYELVGSRMSDYKSAIQRLKL